MRRIGGRRSRGWIGRWRSSRWWGSGTTLPLHQRIMRDAEFQKGDYTIRWLERFVARRE
jgi:biotin carboxylase